MQCETKIKDEATKALAKLYALADPLTDQQHGKVGKVKQNMSKLSKPTDEMLYVIVSWLKEEGIDVVCAPFEAEWQLVFVEKIGFIDGIMTEDGDVIALGAQNAYVGTVT